MSTCLRCDGCSKVVSEAEEDLRLWWRLERYAIDWIAEPGLPQPQVSSTNIEMHSVIVDNRGGDWGEFPIEVDYDEEVDSEALEAFADDAEIIMPPVTMHFCCVACLSTWATQASAIEG